jgi:hypothetical protein
MDIQKNRRYIKVAMHFATRLLVGFLVCATTPAHAADIRQIRLSSNEKVVKCAALDRRHGIAYFGVAPQDFPYTLEGIKGAVVSVRLSDFKRSNVIYLKKGENPTTTAILDHSGNYGFFGIYGDPNHDIPGSIVKLRLNDGHWLGSISLGKGEYGISSAVMDKEGAIGYFGTIFGTVVGVRLSDLTVAASLGLQREDNAFQCGVIDPKGDFGYFGTKTGNVMKIGLRDFTPAGNSTLLRTQTGFRIALLSPTGTSAYFGTEESPARLFEMDLADLRVTRKLTLDDGENVLVAGFMDASLNRAILVTGSVPATVLTIDLSSLSVLTRQHLPVGLGRATCGVYDPARHAVVLGIQNDNSAELIRVPLH